MNDLATWVLFIWLMVDTIITILQQKTMDNFQKYIEMNQQLWTLHRERHNELDEKIEEIKNE